MIAELLAHDRSAPQRFVARYDAFFRSVILWASPAARPFANELIQEVYVLLWRHDFRVLRQWRREHPLQGYLRIVVTRLVWECLARMHPIEEELGEDALHEAGLCQEYAPAPPTPEQLVCARETVRILREVIATLRAEDRRVLELRYYYDADYREIADVLGITPNNAGVRLNRALGRLKAALRLHAKHWDACELQQFCSAA